MCICCRCFRTYHHIYIFIYIYILYIHTVHEEDSAPTLSHDDLITWVSTDTMISGVPELRNKILSLLQQYQLEARTVFNMARKDLLTIGLGGPASRLLFYRVAEWKRTYGTPVVRAAGAAAGSDGTHVGGARSDGSNTTGKAEHTRAESESDVGKERGNQWLAEVDVFSGQYVSIPDKEGKEKFLLKELHLGPRIVGDLATLFSHYDFNRNGEVAVKFFKNMLQGLGHYAHPDEIARMVDLADPHGDGTTDFLGFCYAMRGMEYLGMVKPARDVNMAGR
jgi:hypothetical protein